MSQNIVAHPETGQPVLQQVSYVEIERANLEQEVAAKQAELDALTSEQQSHEALAAEIADRKAKAEAALEDSKSNVSSYDAIAGVTPVETPAEGASSETEDEDAEGPTDAPATDEVEVPVNVVETADSY